MFIELKLSPVENDIACFNIDKIIVFTPRVDGTGTILNLEGQKKVVVIESYEQVFKKIMSCKK